MYDGGKIIGFIGVIHFPHPTNTKIKKVTRLVILPDYQGIGLGTRFLTEIAKYYDELGFDFRITTSAKNLIRSLNKKSMWGIESYGRHKKTSSMKKELLKTFRGHVKTASFKYYKQKPKKLLSK